jgi:hypothetical protein
MLGGLRGVCLKVESLDFEAFERNLLLHHLCV